MESLSETTWDVVISGTGLQQSLLALALSRSDKKILHLDPNEYYGGNEAALSLQEAEAWVDQHAHDHEPASGRGPSSVFSSASLKKPADAQELGLAPARAYTLALEPQMIPARSALISQLVSSQASGQLEFQAVGAFFVFRPATKAQPDGSSSDSGPLLARIPSTREDVFSTSAVSARAKRALMKFLKFVLDYDAEGQREAWEPYADQTLAEFLTQHFKLEPELQTYVITLTLSLDGKITTRDGLAVIHRHLTSMGYFGPGFAAIYPKWGGAAEIAQVACRAGAVGGAVYMLGTGIAHTQPADEASEGGTVQLGLTSGDTIKTRLLVREGAVAPNPDSSQPGSTSVSRLIAVVKSPLHPLFETTVEGAPVPAVSVVAIPAGSQHAADDSKDSEYPIYAVVHSSDTGECPAGQSVIYLTTITTPASKTVLETALTQLLDAISNQAAAASSSEDHDPSTTTPSEITSIPILYQMSYDQQSPTKQSGSSVSTPGPGPGPEGTNNPHTLHLPVPAASLAFNDAALDHVHRAWKRVMGFEEHGVGLSGGDGDDVSEYMVFSKREGMDDDEDEF